MWRPFGLPLANFLPMKFYPVYRLRRINGSFSRIGSMLEAGHPRGARDAPIVLEQATALFERDPGDRILLGPLCASAGREGSAVTEGDGGCA